MLIPLKNKKKIRKEKNKIQLCLSNNTTLDATEMFSQSSMNVEYVNVNYIKKGYG